MKKPWADGHHSRRRGSCRGSVGGLVGLIRDDRSEGYLLRRARAEALALGAICSRDASRSNMSGNFAARRMSAATGPGGSVFPCSHPSSERGFSPSFIANTARDIPRASRVSTMNSPSTFGRWRGRTVCSRRVSTPSRCAFTSPIACSSSANRDRFDAVFFAFIFAFPSGASRAERPSRRPPTPSAYGAPGRRGQSFRPCRRS